MTSSYSRRRPGGQEERCNESQAANLSVVHSYSSSLHRLLPAPAGNLKIPPWLSSERLDQPTDRRPEQGRDIFLVQVVSYQRCCSPPGTVWVSCDVRRDLDWALSCAGTADSFEFHCGNFHVAQLLLRAWHGKRRRFPCTAADFHSCVGGFLYSPTPEGPWAWTACCSKTVVVIIQSSN